jgi:hypothetical protein
LPDLTPKVVLEELAAAPVTWVDGKHDKWDSAPELTGHL